MQNTVMAYLKRFIGTKSLDTKQCPAGLSPRLLPHCPPKPWGCERIRPNSQKFTHFLHQKKRTSLVILITFI